MAIFPNLCVRLKLYSSKYFNVFMWLQFSPSLILEKISHSQTASYLHNFHRDSLDLDLNTPRFIRLAFGHCDLQYPFFINSLNFINFYLAGE